MSSELSTNQNSQINPRYTAIFLGSGTSTGVPLIGCDCAVCCSNDPKNHRLRSSLLISDGAQNILIDASPDLRSQFLREKITNLDYVFYTHAHADHIFGTDDLRAINFKHQKSLPCFATSSTIKDLQQTFAYIFKPRSDYIGGGLPKLTLNEVRFNESFTLGNLTVTPFKLIHGKMVVTGFRFGDLAYATDCNQIPAESYAVLKGVKKLIITGIRPEKHPTHFSISEAIAESKKIQAEETWLTHLTHMVDYASIQRELPAGVQLAYDGLRIRF